MDEPKETIQLTKDIIPDSTSFDVKISGDSMEPEFEGKQIAWVLKQDMVENEEIGIVETAFQLSYQRFTGSLSKTTRHAVKPCSKALSPLSLSRRQ